MIKKIEDFFESEFSVYKKTLAEISRDTKNKVSFIDITEGLYLSYDDIVEQFYGTTPCSPDLIHFKNGKIYFVEFKNGKIDRKKDKDNLKLKGIEGGLITLYKILSMEYEEITFEDIVSLKKVFIIVYNKEKNEDENSRTGAIITHFHSLPVRFGLEIYKNTLFENVITISENIFVEKILPQLA
ncbi:MAG: hypothetical protein KAX49_15925 [Halanaerobiales bacterium]|nr:hypothetical protein [Halanaerobiales bacterium]